MTRDGAHTHGPGGSSAVLAAALIAAVVAYRARHLLAELVIWVAVVVGLVLVTAAVVLAVRLAIRHRPNATHGSVSRGKHSRLPWLRHLPRAVWAALRWHHLTRNLALAYPDKQVTGKVRRPRAVILPTAHGVAAKVRTVPGSGREDFDKVAEHIADSWRCQRVSVSQPKPGRLIVRGLRRDPLLEVLTEIPVGRDLRHLYLGRDEHGTHRFADLANVPGICVGGMPGAGKSTEITSWLTQLAPSPAVQFALADGKNAGEFDDFEDRAYVMAGDDLDAVIDLLEKQHTLMTDRLAIVRQVLGVKNAWHKGPTEAWPLAVTVLDECFPAGTLVGGKPIEQIRIGDRVPSWDEKTGQACTGTVTHLFQHPCAGLVRIHLDDGVSITCTPNHPLMTNTGWQAAGNLNTSVQVLSIHGYFDAAPPPGRISTGGMQQLREDISAGQSQAGVLVAEDRQGDMLIRVPVGDTQPCSQGGSAEYAGASCEARTADARVQSDARSGDQGQGDSYQEDPGLVGGVLEWREWPGSDGTAAASGRGAGLADRSGGEDRESLARSDARAGHSVALQAGYREPGAEGGCRGRRPEPQIADGSGEGPAQGGVAFWRRVDRVEVLQPGSDGRYGGLCPDGYVYNFEVAGTHVYRVGDGVVAHNCQSYLDLTAVKGDKQLEPKVRRCIFLTSSLIRRGRSCMMLTIPATQKPTTDSLPSSIRDNCPISLCFGVKTIDAAAATLGTEIRRYESYSPVTLADPAYAGCCTATLKTGQDPFTRLRGPYVTEAQAAEVAAASAHLRRDPGVSLPVVVPDDASTLVGS